MHHMIGRRMRNSSLVWVVCVIVSLLVIYKLIGYLYFLMLSSHYKSYIPESLEVAVAGTECNTVIGVKQVPHDAWPSARS